MIQFTAKPAWALTPSKDDDDPQGFEPMETPRTSSPEIILRAIARVEYRTLTLMTRIDAALASVAGPVIIAKPPNDLPALLRTADQLLTFARQEAGARPTVWRCQWCGGRHAVPVTLMRPVSIRCERCGRTIDVDPAATSPALVADPLTAEVNDYRRALSGFFREAMARGWPVLVSKVEP